MKLVTLKNFKSYDTQMVHDLSPRINLFIGQNGQGKSNFFKGTIPSTQPSSSRSPTKFTSTAANTTPTCTYCFS
jgi:DNA replication and repair protein RecF